jgi:hypothetical protein
LKSETVRFAKFTKKPRASARSRSTEGFAEGTYLPRVKAVVKGKTVQSVVVSRVKN